MLWDVYIVDYVEKTCEIVMESVSLGEAKNFQSLWEDSDSLVVILPLGFQVCQV
jgi:hypothetical protein